MHACLRSVAGERAEPWEAGDDLGVQARDGYVVIRGAFDADTAAACLAVIWDWMGGQEIRADDPATWPFLVELDGLAGDSFTAAGR
jgi:hypothetical protein